MKASDITDETILTLAKHVADHLDEVHPEWILHEPFIDESTGRIVFAFLPFEDAPHLVVSAELFFDPEYMDTRMDTGQVVLAWDKEPLAKIKDHGDT